MKLWVLVASAYPDTEYVVGVYSTRAKAKAQAKGFKQGPGDWYMTIEEHTLDERKER